jgi:hypothetical protein
MTRPISPFSMAYSVLAGPILWFVHFFAVYVIAEFGCRINFSNLVFVTAESIRLWITVLTIVVLILVAFGGLLAYRNWRQLPANGGNGSPIDARLHFLVVIAMCLSALFWFSIIFTAMPAFFGAVCDQAA